MTEPRIGSLFSGYGGLEQGVQSVLGGTVAWHSEIDPGACKILAHRYPDVPNLGDITAVDWSAVEPVDVLTGGFPCQDVSAAGKRLGIKPGTRSGLWSQFAYAIDQLRPGLVVIENVRGLLSADAQHPAHSDLEPCPWCVGDGDRRSLRALGAVLGELADLGYDASWQGLRAADVGAPHGRFRVFVIAWPAADAGRLRGDARRLAAPGEAAGGRALAVLGERRRVDAAADAQGDRRHEGWPESAGLIGGSDAALGGAPAAAHPDSDRREGQPRASSGRDGVRLDERDDADGRGRGAADPHTPGIGRRSSRRDDGLRPEGLVAVDWGAYGDAIRRWERCLGRSAPSPTELSAKGSPRLSPRFVEWMMGLPAGWVTDVPGLGRNEQLKALGNGVVPAQAAHALRLLLPDVAVAA